MTDWRKHPEYTDGFVNEMEGEPHRATSSEPYIAGWKAVEAALTRLQAAARAA